MSPLTEALVAAGAALLAFLAWGTVLVVLAS